VQGTVTGDSQVHLDVAGEFIPDFFGADGLTDVERRSPFNLGIRTDVTIDCDVNLLSTPAGVASSGAATRLRFDDIELDMREFFDGFPGPAFKVMQSELQPLEGALDFLTEPAGVIGDLLGRDFTILARIFHGIHQDKSSAMA